MIRYAIPASFLFVFGLLSACETVEGAGEDVEDAGQAISQTAEEADDE